MSFEASMEPYAQLVRSLLPRAAALCLFDHTGKLLWSSVASTNPDLFALVLQSIAQLDGSSTDSRRRRPALRAARRRTGLSILAARRSRRARRGGGGGLQPARRATPTCCRSPTCTIICSPALELLRRDLLARADIDQLNES